MPSPPPPKTAAAKRAYSAAHFALELDSKQDIGLCRSIEGGGVKVDVMTYQKGGDYDRWRQLGKQKYEDIKVQVGMAMSQPFYEWIEAFFEGKALRKDGAVLAADFHYKERARRNFTNAMIKELTFPKLDAADKGAAYMSVGFAVEGITFAPGSNNKLTPAASTEYQKLWTACNFRFSLDGFEQPCRRVSKIDSFTIKQNVLEYHAGGSQAPIKAPSQIDFPNLSFYVPESDAEPFFKHANARAMIPVRDRSASKNGVIEAYDTERGTLFTLEFYGADICNVAPDKGDSQSEEIKQVKIDLSVEKMKFNYVPNDKLGTYK